MHDDDMSDEQLPAWKITKTWFVTGPLTPDKAHASAVGEADDTVIERVDSPYCIGSGQVASARSPLSDGHMIRGSCPSCADAHVLENRDGRLRKHVAR